jgi:hypothetical protein
VTNPWQLHIEHPSHNVCISDVWELLLVFLKRDKLGIREQTGQDKCAINKLNSV